jgi:hypothetical protein
VLEVPAHQDPDAADDQCDRRLQADAQLRGDRKGSRGLAAPCGLQRRRRSHPRPPISSSSSPRVSASPKGTQSQAAVATAWLWEPWRACGPAPAEASAAPRAG